MVRHKRNGANKSPEDIFVTTVIVATDDTDKLAAYISALEKKLAGSYTNYEILVVDNDARCEEAEAVVALLDTLPCIRVIRLSRRASYDTAIFAGLEAAIGDYVCTLNSSLDPIEILPELIAYNHRSDVVQGVSRTPITGVQGSRLGRRLFYWYNRKYLGIDIPLNATYLASHTRRAVNALTNTSRSHRHIRHFVRLIGYRPKAFMYNPKQNPGNQRNVRTGAIEALEIVASYSTHPLRFVTWLGVLAGIVNVFYAIYVIVLNIARAQVAAGWMTTSLQLSAMFFVLFVIMVVLAEYIGRILAESRKEPNYYVVDEFNSTVSLADVSRRNISK